MLTLKSPAKINWFLLILGKRADGYHDIQSLMQCVSLYDTITFEDSDTIEVITEAAIPPEENLVYKAALLLKKASATERGARITLKKHIPVAAGLGGGSSDCACTLSGLNSLWGLDFDRAELSALAGWLGSDIPFFLNGHAALVEGRGERVTPVGLRRAYSILLAKPSLSVSTRWAYSKLTKKSSNINNIKLFTQALGAGDFSSLNPMIRNDLENPVFEKHPVVRELRDGVLESGALVSAMSGSGPTVFGVFRSRREAEKVAGVVSADWSAVVETLV